MIEPLKFYSTNHNAEEVTFSRALLQGQAPDRGLYMPVAVPQITAGEMEKYRSLDYSGIAFDVARRYMEGELPDEELMRIAADS